jgi:hypothetical protein
MKRRNIKILMDDRNAQVGPGNEGLEHVIGRHEIVNTSIKWGKTNWSLCKL